MSQQQSNSPLEILNEKYASTSMKTLVQLNPYEDMGYFAMHYRECADRLAASHRGGDPRDDAILMPFLTLYRQAYELLLKDLALCIAAHRVHSGDHSSQYSRTNMEQTIRSRPWGHNLDTAFTWVTNEIDQLNLSDDDMPDELTKAVELLHQIDPTGTAFRYPPENLSQSLNVDLKKLQTDLSDGYHWLEAVYDFTNETLSAAP